MKRSVSLFILIALFSLVAVGQEVDKKKDKTDKTDQNLSKTEVLKRLEKKLAGIKTVQADFVQEKRLAVFKHKLVIKGKLAVQNPNRIAWHVTKPVRYNMVIIGSKLSQWDEDTNNVQTMKLDKDPNFKAAFQQLTAWFSGQYASLRKKYDVTIEATDPCILLFVPKKKSDMEKIIKQVRLVFRKDERYIETMTIDEGNGNSTVFRFSNTRLNKPVDKDVWKVRPSG